MPAPARAGRTTGNPWGATAEANSTTSMATDSGTPCVAPVPGRRLAPQSVDKRLIGEGPLGPVGWIQAWGSEAIGSTTTAVP